MNKHVADGVAQEFNVHANVDNSSNSKQQERLVNKTLLSNDWHSLAVQLLVGSIMFVIYIWIASGVGMLIYEVVKASASAHEWHTHAAVLIKNCVIMLAALELVRTLQSYLATGRVRMTFIIDAALVVLVGELISLWYRKYSVTEVVMSLVVIAVLVGLRIITCKYSPNEDQLT